MNNLLSNNFKEQIFLCVKGTQYTSGVIRALDSNDINSLRVYLSDYLDDITPQIRPLFNTDQIDSWNFEVTRYQHVYTIYNSLINLLEQLNEKTQASIQEEQGT